MAEPYTTDATVAALLSERDELLRQLRRTELLWALAKRANSEFLTTMPHELRTPLNAIIGFSEILLESGTEIGEEHWRQSLEKIREAGWKLHRLITEMVDLASVDVGVLALEPQAFSVSEALQGLYTITLPLAQKKRQAFELSVEDSSLMLYHDVGRFKQVIYNLLTNAIRFTPERGRILTLVRHSATERVEIVVQDTGIGIAPEDQKRIVAAFEQIECGYAYRHEGAGLGLYLIYHLTRLMGGTVDFRSIPGEGSTFTLHLPTRHAQRREAGC